MYAGATYLSVAPVLSGDHAAEPGACMCSGTAADHCACGAGCLSGNPVSGCAYLSVGCGCGAHADVGVDPGRVILHLKSRPVGLDTAFHPGDLWDRPLACPYSVHTDPPEKIPLSTVVLPS